MTVLIPAGFENLQATGKEEVIQEMIEILTIAGKILPEDIKKIVKAIMDREAVGTTGIMNGVGVPHARCDGIKELICCVGRSIKGIKFESLDDQPVFILFLLLSPKSNSGEHLFTLALLSKALREEKIIKVLRQACSADEMVSIMNEVV